MKQEDHKFKFLPLKNDSIATLEMYCFRWLPPCWFLPSRVQMGVECFGFALTVHRRLFVSHSPSSPWPYFLKGYQETGCHSTEACQKESFGRRPRARPFPLHRTMPTAALPLPAGNAWEKRGGPLPRRTRASGISLGFLFSRV